MDSGDGLTPDERRIAEEGLEQAAMKFLKGSDVGETSDIDMEEGATKRKKKSKPIPKKQQEFDVKLAVCNEVKSYPELYQINHKKYHDKELKEAIWQKVSDAVTTSIGLPCSVAVCKKFWTALKESTR